MAAWLTNDGRYIANFGTRSTGELRPHHEAQSNEHIVEERRIRLRHPDGDYSTATVTPPATFPSATLGADTGAGPNVTGQPAVNSQLRHRERRAKRQQRRADNNDTEVRSVICVATARIGAYACVGTVVACASSGVDEQHVERW